MPKSKELSITAAQIANGTTAFIIVKVDKDGRATIHAEGNTFELCYMKESLGLFIKKLISGEIKNNV